MATSMLAVPSTRRERWAWYLYDFGNSAYASVVLLAVYSAYFQGQVVGGAEGTRQWGRAVFFAMLIVALSAPVLGAIADFSGTKKRFLLFFTAMACIFTASLFFAKPGYVLLGTGFFILAEIGYRSAQVFYNGLLPEIATQEEVGRVSGYGWAIGTAGGIVCLLLILPLIVLFGDKLADDTLIVRLSMVITAVFFAVSAVPIFLWLQERAEPRVLPPGENYLSVAFKRLWQTIKNVGHYKEFVKFIIAFLIYNDGIIMALDFAAIIGAVLFGMDQQMLIVFVIVVQITNVIGAFVFGYLVDRIGGKPSLIASLLLMIVVVIWLFLNQTQIRVLPHRGRGWLCYGRGAVGQPDDGRHVCSAWAECRVLWLFCFCRTDLVLHRSFGLWHTRRRGCTLVPGSRPGRCAGRRVRATVGDPLHWRVYSLGFNRFGVC